MSRGYKHTSRKKNQNRRDTYDKENIKVKQLENEVCALKKENKETVYALFGMLHDIMTPMNAMVGLSDMALEYAQDHEEMRDCLFKIKNSVSYLSSLLGDIMDLAQYDTKVMTLQDEAFSLSEFMENLMALCRPQFLMSGQELFYCETDISGCRLVGDKMKLSRLLGNLLSNANKYTPIGGRIRMYVRRIACSQAGYAKIEFTVEDNGYGMSKAFQEDLFRPFVREETVRMAETKGTGLGLAVVKSIVDMMDGTIAVESEPGCGTAFRIVLPFQMDESEEASRREEGYVQKDRQGIEDVLGKEACAGREDDRKGCVLFADDNFINQEIGRQQLEKLQYTVELASSGLEVIERVKGACDQPYSMIFLDLHMPKMTGCETARKIRQLEMPWCRKIPIFAVTASVLPEELAQVAQSGMNGYLQKPVSITQLRRTLELCNADAPSRMVH